MKTATILLAATGLLMLSGCSAITDFQAPDQKMEWNVAGVQTVTLAGNLGTLSIQFDDELPVDHEEEIYDLIGNEITLMVTNEDNGVGVSLTSAPVTAEPAAPGEYAVQVSTDNRTLTITFFNETTEGYALRPGGNYIALLHVAENDYFETGDFTPDIEVE